MLFDLIAWVAMAGYGQTPHRLYACGAESRGYAVGAPLPPSGLFLFGGQMWKQLGFNHPAINAAAYDPRNPLVIYLAAGNGCIRSADGGRSWRILTDWRMTELQDVTVDARARNLYVALPDGVGFSGDEGRTWVHRDNGITRKFVQTVAVDSSRAGRVLAGAEQGIYASDDAGAHWTLVGAGGVMITDLAQSPADAQRWMAATQRGGLFASTDGGRSWTKAPGISADQTLYSVSFDPHEAQRVAVCGWQLGVKLSEDGGKTWQDRSAGLPSRKVWRISFDPAHPKRLWASVHEEAAFVSDDLGVTWRRNGLEGWIVRDFVFVPEAKQ